MDVPLDEAGIAQAKRAAGLLAHLQPAAIVTSDLSRAARTAAELGAVTGLHVVADPALRETDFGAWEGLEWTELRTRYAEQFAEWDASPHARPGGDGESRIEVAQRVVASVLRHLEAVPDGATLVVVTHGAAARIAIGHLLELPPERWVALGVLTNCSWSVLLEASSGFRLIEYNSGTLPEPPLADDN